MLQRSYFRSRGLPNHVPDDKMPPPIAIIGDVRLLFPFLQVLLLLLLLVPSTPGSRGGGVERDSEQQ